MLVAPPVAYPYRNIISSRCEPIPPDPHALGLPRCVRSRVGANCVGHPPRARRESCQRQGSGASRVAARTRSVGGGLWFADGNLMSEPGSDRLGRCSDVLTRRPPSRVCISPAPAASTRSTKLTPETPDRRGGLRDQERRRAMSAAISVKAQYYFVQLQPMPWQDRPHRCS